MMAQESKEEREARIASLKNPTQLPVYQQLRKQRLMDANIVINASSILTAILPLLPSPSDAHLKELEEALMRHVIWSPPQVRGMSWRVMFVSVSVSCCVD